MTKYEPLKNEQLIVDPINGDCFRACVTSLLGIPNTNELPDGGDKEWFIKWSNYLGEFGIDICYEKEACWRNGYWIASVKSLNFPDVTHAIIMNGSNVYFDPSTKNKYTSGEGLLGKDVVLGGWYFEVIDFSKLCAKFGTGKETVKLPSEEEIARILDNARMKYYVPGQGFKEPQEVITWAQAKAVLATIKGGNKEFSGYLKKDESLDFGGDQ